MPFRQCNAPEQKPDHQCDTTEATAFPGAGSLRISSTSLTLLKLTFGWRKCYRERIPKADKLLLSVDIGEKSHDRFLRHRESTSRTLLRRKIAVVANLKPANAGVESQGMLLAASVGDEVSGDCHVHRRRSKAPGLSNIRRSTWTLSWAQEISADYADTITQSTQNKTLESPFACRTL